MRLQFCVMHQLHLTSVAGQMRDLTPFCCSPGSPPSCIWNRRCLGRWALLAGRLGGHCPGGRLRLRMRDCGGGGLCGARRGAGPSDAEWRGQPPQIHAPLPVTQGQPPPCSYKQLLMRPCAKFDGPFLPSPAHIKCHLLQGKPASSRHGYVEHRGGLWVCWGNVCTRPQQEARQFPFLGDPSNCKWGRKNHAPLLDVGKKIEQKVALFFVVGNLVFPLHSCVRRTSSLSR